jgi:hypothetical protein
MPLPNRHNSSTSIHSINPATVADTSDTYETAHLPPQSPSLTLNSPNTILSTRRPFSPTDSSSQPLAGPLGRLHSHNSPPFQDLIDRNSTGILPSPTSTPFNNLLPSHIASSESNSQSVPSVSFDHFSWAQDQSSSSTQQEQATLAAPLSSRRTSSPGLIQTQTPPFSPPVAPSSRNVGRPFSEHAADMRCTHRPPPAAPVPVSRSLPPPAPPTILDPPPARNSARSFRAPHEPFLSDAPPPPDSWIAVETSQAEYRLNARLPGFRRDAMCVIFFVTSTFSLTDDITLRKNLSCKAAEGIARCGRLVGAEWWCATSYLSTLNLVFLKQIWTQVILRDVYRLGMTPTSVRSAPSLTARFYV